MKQTQGGNSIILVHNWNCHLLSWTVPLSYKAKLRVSCPWWQLNRGDCTIKELPSLGSPKGGPGCSIEMVALKIEAQFAILWDNYFGTLVTGRLIESGPLIGGRLMDRRFNCNKVFFMTVKKFKFVKKPSRLSCTYEGLESLF